MSSMSDEWVEPGNDNQQGLADQIAAVRRRLLPMLLTFVIVLASAAAAAVLWPPTYRSMGTILIEQQEIPLDFVRSAVTSYADERVQVISQRVMTSSNLWSIIEKYGLYADLRESDTRDQIIERMRKDVQREMISAEVVDPRAGRTTQATIAFAVGFESESPELAVRVANDLVTLYLQKNIETRKQQAAGTTQFLTEETERLRKRIGELEQQVAEFKARNYEQLPEFAQTNVMMLSRTSEQLRDTDNRMQGLSQQIAFLQAQLSQIEPRAPAVTEQGAVIMAPTERLRSLRTQYVSELARYTSKHPTVAGLRRELNVLEAQIGGGNAATGALDELEKGYSELFAAKDRGDDAEVQRLESLIGNLGTRIKNMPVSGPDQSGASGRADNPAYISIQAALQSAMSERSSLQAQRVELGNRIHELERRQSMAPQVERDYAAMQRDLQGEQAKFAEVRQKLLDAQLSQNLESEQRGERFTIIEPPTQPQEPIRPNRPAIFGIGFVLALGAAIGMLVLLEAIDTRVRGRRQIEQLVGAPPIAIIPWVADDEPVQRFKFWRRGPRLAPSGA
jgi:polysaccharide biosynthesis transport protein